MGGNKEWEQELTTEMLEAANDTRCPSDIFVSRFDMMSESASDVTPDLEGVPGVISIIHATTLAGKHSQCAAEVRRYLTECEAVLNYTGKLGGTSIVMLKHDAPYWASSLFGRMMLNFEWDQVYCRSPAMERAVNSTVDFTIITNNWCVLRGLHGYKDAGQWDTVTGNYGNFTNIHKSFAVFICEALAYAI